MADFREECDYAPYYCEENVYRLAEKLGGSDRMCADGRAVFVTNPGRTVALLSQRAGNGPGGVVVWDYHVMLLTGAAVYDLDTQLPCPLPAGEWLHHSAPQIVYESYPDLTPQFIEVPLPAFLAGFSSDRRHMKQADGKYIHPPPAWDAPFSPELGHTLPAFLDATHPDISAVTSLSQAYEQW